MTTKTTNHLGRRSSPADPLYLFFAQRDPLALIAIVASLALVLILAGVSAWRAAASAPAAAPEARPMIIFQTLAPRPTAAPTATAVDPALAALQATVQAQQAQLAALQAQLAEQQRPAAAQAAQEAPEQAPAAETAYTTSSAPEAAPAPLAPPITVPGGPADWEPTGRASDEEIARLRAAWLAAGQASIDRQKAQAQP